MSSGNSEKLWSPEGQKISHLERLRWRPKPGPIDINLSIKETMAVLFPMKVPSSKYHTEKSIPSISPILSKTTKEKRREPRGSPCWIPAEDSTL